MQSRDCALMPFVGTASSGGDESCDDGNQDNEDECSTLCQPPRCGDGFVQSDEDCDDGNDLEEDACTNSCMLAACGDGITRADIDPRR